MLLSSMKAESTSVAERRDAGAKDNWGELSAVSPELANDGGSETLSFSHLGADSCQLKSAAAVGATAAGKSFTADEMSR